jgi:hypothetical protein
VPQVLEALGEREHLPDVLGRAWEDVGREQVHRGGIGVVGRFVRVGNLGGCLALEARGHEHRVVAAVESLVAKVADIGDVLTWRTSNPWYRSAHRMGQEEEGPEVADIS